MKDFQSLDLPLYCQSIYHLCLELQNSEFIRVYYLFPLFSLLKYELRSIYHINIKAKRKLKRYSFLHFHIYIQYLSYFFKFPYANNKSSLYSHKFFFQR